MTKKNLNLTYHIEIQKIEMSLFFLGFLVICWYLIHFWIWTISQWKADKKILSCLIINDTVLQFNIYSRWVYQFSQITLGITYWYVFNIASAKLFLTYQVNSSNLSSLIIYFTKEEIKLGILKIAKDMSPEPDCITCEFI